MKAFLGSKKLKSQMVAEIGKHRKMDAIEQGHYGKQNGHWKGCAVACSLRSLAIIKGEKLVTQYDQHSRYETDLGIPRTIARLEDRIFEGLTKEKAVLWPERFIKAIKPGADLSLVTAKLMLFIVQDVQQFVNKEKYPNVIKAIQTVENLYTRKLKGEVITDQEWEEARHADAADAADAYAAYAADAAAAYAADAAYAAYAADAYAAARQTYWAKIADKLIELLKACK